jgi:hypothetical protein
LKTFRYRTFSAKHYGEYRVEEFAELVKGNGLFIRQLRYEPSLLAYKNAVTEFVAEGE